ncbi:MAG TPA: alpha/beta hydrolase [Roseomonas sp.]
MPSLRAWLMMGLIRLSGMKRKGADTRRMPEYVRLLQARGPAEPGRARERRLSIGRESFGGHAVFTAAPRKGGSGHHILYLHGGAYVLDLLDVHWRVIEGLIERTGATVTIPLYPLAPAHCWRDVFGMVRPLHVALAARHGAANLTVAGDSAGGGMALALAQQLRDAGEALPGRLLLFSPWLDVTTSDPRALAIAPRDPMIPISGARMAGAWYARDLSTRDPRISPIFGSVAGLPPIAVFTGTRDVLNADAHLLRAKAAEEGTELAFHEYDRLFHVWVALPIPEARQALDEAAAFMEPSAPPG